MATKINVRLDDDTERKLDELVNQVNERTSFVRITQSDIVRAGIERLYAEEVEKSAQSRQKAGGRRGSR